MIHHSATQLTSLPHLYPQTFLTFSPEDPHLLVSNSDDQVVFYQWVSLKQLACTIIHYSDTYSSGVFTV